MNPPAPLPERETLAVPLMATLLLAGLALLAGQRDFGVDGANLPWLSAAITFLALVPSLGWWAARRRGGPGAAPIPFLPAAGVLYAVYYGLPYLLSDDLRGPNSLATTGSALRSQTLALAGWSALLLGWRAARPVCARLRPLTLRLEPERARRAIAPLLGIGFASALALRSLPLPGGLVQPVRFLGLLFQVGLGLLALFSFRGQLSRDARLVLWLFLVPAYLFLQVGVGSVAQLVYASLFLFFLAWGSGRRVPMLSLLLLAVAVLLLRGHVHAFRQKVWDEQGSESDAGVWERSALFVEIVAREVREEGGGALARAVREVSDRLAHARTFAHVVELTPERVPYWRGGSYAALPSTLVPRALWPDKPTKEVGQEFGHRYRLLAPGDRTTSVNLPQTVELYANFGSLGVVLGMLALGALWRLLHRLWNTPSSGDGTLLLAALLFSRLILLESDFALVYGALAQTAVLLLILFRWLGPARPAAPRLAPEGSP